jgi:serine/threonine protein kinase/Tol biopolymer transport system component
MNNSDPERWQRVKEIFQGALERKGAEREAFLTECCDDEDLRSEVESLLRSYEVAGSFMESPAVAQAADSLAGAEQKLSAGQRVKHYQIVNLIGEGGMGEVYLATDTILGRRVALKVLPSFVRNDADRLRRFTQEARAASRLSHPNVCVVHEIGETDDGRPFIAMEYVEGVTLRHRLKSQALKLGDVLDIAIQVADALTAAHDTGIVHRDIKPENIMIRPEGYVKILDFGLAKLTERHKGALQTTMSTLLFQSSPGTVIGTAAYMSPEQARGVQVDERTDIWGLGVVLYEMASGIAPFTGETPTDVVVAIVEKDQPPISRHVEGIPTELERIVKKALRKDRSERYQIVKELAIDLRSLRRELEINSLLERSMEPGVEVNSGEGIRAPTGREKIVDTNELKAAQTRIHEPARPINRAWIVIAAAIVLAVIGFGIYKLRPRNDANTRVPFGRFEVTKLTTTGNATMAAMSPDGKYVTYVINEGGKSSLWLRQVAINSNAQLITPREGRYMGVVFSPDGNLIYFAYAGSDRNDAGQIYQLPVLGIGVEPTRIDSLDGLPALSNDKKRIAFLRYDRANQKDELIVANADGSGQQIVATRTWPARLGSDLLTTPQWTAGDKSLLLPAITSDSTSNTGIAASHTISLYEKDLATGAERSIPLSPEKFDEVGRLTVLPDGSGVIMLARSFGASYIQIWTLARDGSVRAVTSDLSDYKELSLRTDASALVTVQSQVLARVWLLRKGETKPTPITSGTSRFYDLYAAPDDKIVYASDASGIADIFEIGSAGETRQLTSNGKRNYAPSVSPDNRYLAFHSNRAGVFQVWRSERDGSSPKQLTFGSSESTWPSFSPDGKWIIYQHYEQGTPFALWRLPVDGGTPQQLTEGVAIRSEISPDGKLVAFWYNDMQGNSTWILKVIQFEGGATVKVFEVPGTVQVNWDSPLHWSPDGRYITFVDHRGGFDNIWGQPVEGGEPKQLTNFEEGLILSFDWMKDGSLVASRGQIMSDVVLMNDTTK